ncbi:conserved hypothetical protein [Bathymodiolus platifrons methanotrophic gill symbiont]|uniref:hypothetical protein n=1 Tax=Bathymodiolus platifrons methanotrophic gill symbiont TaxID=113268 RepID=UPI000B42105D|nr:hypothetical protein [Bathymodiolus platifrons methanotrophic gill symbiont]GAW86724.1 conserved hypothetical protein [Bathymodiolus platifrons methanotrophic gill symbiont]
MSFPYKKNIEKSMKKFYDSLCEKNKRRYAAIESEKLSHGGVNYISALLECDPKTIRQGKKELTELELSSIVYFSYSIIGKLQYIKTPRHKLVKKSCLNILNGQTLLTSLIKLRILDFIYLCPLNL